MRSWTLLICLWLASTDIYSQNTVNGKVIDAGTGLPLAGATIKVKRTGLGTSTSDKGIFKIQAELNDILLVSNIGYTEQAKKITQAEWVAIRLEPVATQLAEMVIVGSRGAPRSKMESPVPVDVIKAADLSLTTGNPDLMSQLHISVPGFNHVRQSGGDGTDAMNIATLRGLGSDQTLVLVNGKRRHQSAFVNEVGTQSRGNVLTDLDAIPEGLIDRVEILRDGASAQYGSDAIAGVINIILKRDVRHLTVAIGASGYYDHKYNTLNSVDPTQFYTGSQLDGKTMNLGLDYGLPVGDNGGFIHFAGNFLSQGKTFRAEPDTNISVNPNALPIDIWRRAFGLNSIISGGGMYNAEIPLKGTKTVFYSFGGYNKKLSEAYAWTRSWNNPHRAQPTKFPTDPNGNLEFVPDIMRVYDPAKGQLDTANVYYNPQERVHITDASIALGFKGTLGNKWTWDLSDNTGYNDFHYFGYKTFNASLLPYSLEAAKTGFDDGGFNFLQNTANLDVNRRFDDIAGGLTLSFGGEFRYERYKLYQGELDSYLAGGATLGPGGAPKASGSEGYPGYQPGDAITAHRTNVSGYTEIALDVTPRWLLDLAERVEGSSDFGFEATQKAATRYKLTDYFNIRGSFSTGFRAPSLQQEYFSNTNTNIINGNLVYAKLVPNYSAIARTAGIPKLTQETSTNASLGFAWQPAPGFSLTVDGYSINVRNRIVISGQYQAGDATLGAALNNALASQGIQYCQFFANAVDTRNNGIDLVLDYHTHWPNHTFKATFAGNVQGIKIKRINIPSSFTGSPSDSANFFSDREQYFLKASAPRSKYSLTVEYGVRKFTAGTHLTYFGKLSTLGFGETSAPAGAADPYFPYVTLDKTGQTVPEIFAFSGKVATDVYVSYKMNKSVTWVAGVDNLFNVHPDKSIVPGSISLASGTSSWGDSESGGPFDAVQMGFNGMRPHTKLIFHF